MHPNTPLPADDQPRSPFARVISMVVAVFHLLTFGCLVPINQAQAAAGQYQPAPVFMDFPIGWHTVKVPVDNWQEIGEFGTRYDYNSHHHSVAFISGERWVNLGRYEAAASGNTNLSATNNILMRFASTNPVVFATYDQGAAQLRIKVIKVQKDLSNSADYGKIKTYIADYTPWTAEKLKVEYAYLDKDEKYMAMRTNDIGVNPFERFMNTGNAATADKSDPVFYNVSWNAAQVAVGHAMMKHRASRAFIAMTSTRFTQSTECGGSVFKKKCTTKVDGFAKPVWYIGTPITAQPYGASLAMICAKNLNPCDDPAHVATSGAVFAKWSGGNMNEMEDHLYHWEKSQSSWTVLAFSLVVLAVVFTAGVGLAGMPAFAAAAGTGISAFTLGAIAAVVYAGTSIYSTGGSLTTAQSNFYGTTNNGLVNAPTDQGSEQANGLQEKVHDRLINQQLSGSLTGIQAQYRHDAPTPQEYTETNDVRLMQAAAAQCDNMGLQRNTVIWNQCAAYYSNMSPILNPTPP